MHYYKFNIADYRKDTYPLTPVQHMMYRWLIDEYYLNEKPFPNDMTKLLWRLGLSEDHRNDLELIFENFFEPAYDEDFTPSNPSVGEQLNTCQYWIHPRIEADIADYKALQEKKSKAGKASGKSRGKKEANTHSTPVQQKPDSVELTRNQKPETTNNKQDKKSRGFSPPSLSDVKNYCLSRNHSVDADTFFDFYASKGWMVGRNKMKDWKACVRTWEKRDGANNGQYQQSPAKRGQSLSKSERRDEAARRYLEESNDDGVAWPTGHEVSP